MFLQERLLYKFFPCQEEQFVNSWTKGPNNAKGAPLQAHLSFEVKKKKKMKKADLPASGEVMFRITGKSENNLEIS